MDAGLDWLYTRSVIQSATAAVVCTRVVKTARVL